jgi:exopolysaccharide production protein ExoZ
LRKRFNFLQIARCLAAIMVVIHHTDRILLQKYNIHAIIYQPFDFPFARIDLFFVLSGFIIYYIHRQDLGVKSKAKPFLLKRFVRIIPLYWVVTLLYTILSLATHEHFTAWQLISSYLLLPDKSQPILGVAWTLRYEVFLYLIFCLLMVSNKWLYPVVLCWIGSMIYFLAIGTTFADNPYLDLIFNPLNLEFVAGCLAAQILVKYKPNLSIFGYVGIILLLSSLFLQEYKELSLNHVILWGVPFFFIILGFTSYEIRKEITLNKWLVAIGDASYSIFLTHIIVILSFRKLSDKFALYDRIGHPIWMSLMVCIAAILCGCIFYRVIEKPFLETLRTRFISKIINTKALVHDPMLLQKSIPYNNEV